MTTTRSSTALSSTALSSMKLHANKRFMTFGVPVFIVALAAIISALILVIIWRAGGDPGSTEWVEGARSNPGMLWALSGFLGYLGVQAVSTTFPFALTLGSTRRGFTLGTFLWCAMISAYIAVLLAVLLLIELATDHWFAHFYVFDVVILGAGDVWRLLPIVFLAVLTLLMLAGTFGAAWVRFGPRGPVSLGVVLALIVVIGIIIVVPAAEQLLAAFHLWWLAVAAGVAIAASGVGTWLLLRTATVR